MLLARSRFRAMGSPCEFHLYGESRAALDAVATACRAEIERLEEKYSRYRGTSLATAINLSAGSEAGFEVEDETASLLDYAHTAWVESEGLFDITSGILRRAWDFRSGRLPTQTAVAALLDRVGWQRVRWERPRLVLPLAGMELDFGGFVKEYAADRLAELCIAHGVAAGLIDLGGDLRTVGPHPDGQPWRVGIRDPRRPGSAMASTGLRHGGLATSGDYERCMVVDGVRYGHVLDPRSGWPVTGLVSVSVAASQCLVAGTASTIAMLRGEEAGLAFLDELGLPYVALCRGGAHHAVGFAVADALHESDAQLPSVDAHAA